MEGSILFDGQRGTDTGLLKLSIPVAGKSRKVFSVIAADNSGSMSGRPWQQVQEALISILGSDASMQPAIITYNTNASVLEYTRSNYRERIQAVKAGGTTCFKEAFAAIMKVAEKLVSEAAAAAASTSARRKSGEADWDEFAIVFMTDGCDTTGVELQPAVEKFRKFAASFKVPTTVHAVGFSKDHNFDFLQKMKDYGANPGTFRYAEPSDGADALAQKIEDLFANISGGARTVKVMLEPFGFRFLGEQPTLAEISTLGLAELTAWVAMDQRPVLPAGTDAGASALSGGGGCESAVASAPSAVQLENVSVRVTLPDEGFMQYSCNATARLASKAEATKLDLERLRMQAVDLSKRAAEVLEKGQDALFESTVLQDLTTLQAKVKTVSVLNKKLGKDLRVELLELHAEVQTILDEIHRAVASCAHASLKERDTSVLARASDIRFVGTFTKARRQRRMDQRVAGNINRQAEMDAALKALTRAPGSKATAKSMTPDALDFFFCSLSQMSVVEMMEDDFADVLGFGLAVQRPEAVVDAPTLIDVFGISGTLLSKSAMEDAIRFHLSLDEHVQLSFTDSTEIVSGRSREPINAWLPLYINDQHWSRVRILIEPILGYFACMDPLGFDKDQFNCMFAILGRMLTNMRSSKVNDRDVTMFFAFLRTARAVAVDFGLMPGILEKVQQFVRSPGDRTKDVISNLLTLIGYMLVLDASEMAKLDLPCFIRALIAETVRRAAGDVFHGRSDTTVLELINRLVHGASKKVTALTSAEAAKLLLQPVEAGKPATNLANVAFDPKAHLSILKTAPIDAADTSTEVTATTTTAAAATTSAASSAVVEGEDEAADDGAGTTQTAGPLRLHKQVLKGLAVHGMAQGNAVPGPNIETKTAAAATVAEKWWAGLMQGDGAPEITRAGGGAGGFDPDAINTGTVAILRDIEAEITPRLRPSLATLSMFNELVKFWFAVNQTGNVWDQLDANHGLPPRAWIDSVKACARPEASLFATITALLPSDGNPVQTLRAIVLQAVAFHRNKDARLASASGDYIDVVDVETARKAILKQHMDIAEKQQKALEDIQQYLQWQAANRQMVLVNDIWAFVGMLSKTHQDRHEGFNDLLNMFVNSKTTVPLAKEKIHVLLTGRYEDRPVFARGNSWLPTNVDLREAMKKLIGVAAFDDIEVKILSTVQTHRYRESDLPNRHGSCNSHPHDHRNCPLCQASGFGKGRR